MSDAVTASSILGNLAGWIVLACSFLLPLMAHELRRDRRMALVFWLALLLRQVFALSTGLIYGPLSDAVWFHEWAVIRARDGGLAGITVRVGSEFYERFLGAVYAVLGTSPFLAAELSVFAFAASMIVFANLTRELAITRYRAALLALYALPFSTVFYTSTIMREAYQLLGCVLTVQFALRFRRTGSLTSIALACASAVMMGLLHDALLLFAGLFILLAVVWPIGVEPEGAPTAAIHARRRRVVRYAVLITLVFAGWRLLSEGVSGSMALGAIISKRALEFAVRFREAGFGIEARTTYGVRLDTSSPQAFAASLVPIFGYYMFAPFPWQVRTPADVLGCAEAVLRLVLLIFAVREWRQVSGPARNTRSLLLLGYLTLAGLWALGTINYGTAFRHHITTNWILVLLGGPSLVHAAARAMRRVLQTLTTRPGYAAA